MPKKKKKALKSESKDAVLRLKMLRTVAVPESGYPHAKDGLLSKDAVFENPSTAEAELADVGFAEVLSDG